MENGPWGRPRRQSAISLSALGLEARGLRLRASGSRPLHPFLVSSPRMPNFIRTCLYYIVQMYKREKKSNNIDFMSAKKKNQVLNGGLFRINRNRNS